MKLQVGRNYQITTKYQDGSKTFTARVDWVEQREAYEYFGYTPDNWRDGRHGAARRYNSPKEFGIQSIVEIKEQ